MAIVAGLIFANGFWAGVVVAAAIAIGVTLHHNHSKNEPDYWVYQKHIKFEEER